ncbi:MAG TPA: DUF2203 domain-containing protein [Candidatus Angelobacter sp.]|nr:DUF2203 domain-containing protein [Candidatus Angelobacter sp.]
MIIRTRQRRRPREKYLRRIPRYWSDAREYRRREIGRYKAAGPEEIGEAEDSMQRTFTLAEAHTLLPILESLLRSAMQAKALIEEVDAELEALKSRIFVNGGTFVSVLAVSRRKDEREKAIQRAKDAVAEIDAAGVQVKDLDIGLLDFPCVVGDEVILLCWKWGEESITHWHSTSEGFAGRKPIDERIIRDQKKSN